MPRLIVLAALAALILAVAGCSGGGAYVPPQPAPIPVPLGDTVVLDPQTGTVSNATTGSAGIRFITVSGGTATLTAGDPLGETGAGTSTTGAATIPTLRIGVAELTIAELGAFEDAVATPGAAALPLPSLAAAPIAAFGGMPTPDTPVFGLSYQRIAGLLAQWNAKHPAAKLRLPSAHEWEFACRAGSSTSWSWGDQPGLATQYARVAQTLASANDLGAKPVGSRKPNAFGLYDMHGNLWEWVSDGGTGGKPCLRGGSWSDNLLSATSGNRLDCGPDVPYALAGVRLVLEVP